LERGEGIGGEGRKDEERNEILRLAHTPTKKLFSKRLESIHKFAFICDQKIMDVNAIEVLNNPLLFY